MEKPKNGCLKQSVSQVLKEALPATALTEALWSQNLETLVSVTEASASVVAC